VLASLAATCRQTGSSFADFLVPRLILAPSQARAAASR